MPIVNWLLARAAQPLMLKVLLVAVPLLLAAGGGLAWYTVHLIESRAVARQEAQAWQIAAEGWSRQWEAERARQQATDAQRAAREREREALRRRFVAAEGEISRLRRESGDVRDYLVRQMPAELDAELTRLEEAAGARR